MSGNAFKRNVMLLVLGLALLMGAGCAKKQVASTPGAGGEGQGGMNAAELAARELEEAKRILVTEKIYFAFDSSELTAEARNILNRKADVLKSKRDLKVLVEGHCDERGTDEYNMALGNRRSHATYKYLVTLGVSERQLETISYGEERPVDPGHTESAWANNRRCEFKLVW